MPTLSKVKRLYTNDSLYEGKCIDHPVQEIKVIISPNIRIIN